MANIVKNILQQIMAMDLSTRDVKLRVMTLFGLSEEEATRLLIRAKSEKQKNRVREGRKKIVFLPQCLRKKECKAPLTEEGFKCNGCSQDCQVYEITRNNAIVYFIAPGGAMVRDLILKHKPDAVIGIACCKEVEEGLEACEKVGVPAYGITLLRDGCVNTLVNVDEVKQLFSEVGLNSTESNAEKREKPGKH